MEFMRDALCGRKRLLTNRELAPVNVPRFKEFNTVNLYKAAIADDELRQFLPDPPKKGEKLINRAFLFNVSISYACNKNTGHKLGQGGLLATGNSESSQLKKTKAGTDTKQVHRDD